MLECCTKKILENLLKVVPKDNYYELCFYGIECIILKTVHYFSYFFIACYCEEILGFLIFLTFYAMLRNCVAGYHANSPLGCYLISCVGLFTILKYGNYLRPNSVLIFFLIIMTCFCLQVCPVDNPNRVLSITEKNNYRKKATILYSISFTLIFIVWTSNIVVWIVWAVLMADTMVILGYLKYKLNVYKEDEMI